MSILSPRLFLLAALATGCTDAADEKGGGGTGGVPDAEDDAPVDGDGDGVTDDEDCDDANVAVYPGAEERCDGVDNDCDGQVDEDADDATEWWVDADGDGFGLDETPVTACDAPSGTVANADDCDDTRLAVNPDAEEICDGEDNDCDGVVDGPASTDATTWYLDTDGDGYGDPEATVVDCPGDGRVADATDCDDTDPLTNPAGLEQWYDEADSDCDGEPNPDVCEEVPVGERFGEDPACVYTPAPPTSWSIQTEWSTDPADGWVWSASTNSTHVMMTPVVGQLTDDNGDGFIDDQDIPDIAFTTFWGSSWASYGFVRVVSGDGSGEHYSLGSASDGVTTYLPHGTGGMAIGDIDADGSPDLLVMTYRGRVMALEADGSFKWVSSVDGLGQYSYPSITDMDGDGYAEIIVGTAILDSDGVLLTTAASGSTWGTFAADLDGDGDLEHIGGNSVTNLDGTVVFEDTTSSGGIPAVMDWDGDGYGDVLNQRGGVLTVYDRLGNIIVENSVASDAGGAPCVGDFDGDGAPEVAVAGATSVTAMETDGSIMWSTGSSDPSTGGTPCTAWDFDGDGDFEILVADELTFRILDGATGSALMTQSSHASGTLQEQPVPVDVDRDGNTEIVLASNDYYHSGWDGIRVLGEANDEWTTTRTTWNQTPFWTGNINDDMSIPTPMDMPWDLDNSFRSQRSPTLDPLAAQDFQVEILGVCEDCGEGTVDVWVSPFNAGATWGPPGVLVSLYSDDGASWTLVDVQPTDDTLDPGQRLSPMTFTVDVDTFNAGELVVSIDDDGTGGGAHNECEEENNTDRWVDPVCLE